jgi:hypothetical protein
LALVALLDLQVLLILLEKMVVIRHFHLLYPQVAVVVALYQVMAWEAMVALVEAEVIILRLVEQLQVVLELLAKEIMVVLVQIIQFMVAVAAVEQVQLVEHIER